MGQGEEPLVAVAVELSPVVIQADVTLVKGVLEVLGRSRGEDGGEDGGNEAGEGGEAAAAGAAAAAAAAVVTAHTAAIPAPLPAASPPVAAAQPAAAAATAATAAAAAASGPGGSSEVPEGAAAVWADNYVENWLEQRLLEKRRAKEEMRRAKQRAEEEAADMDASMTAAAAAAAAAAVAVQPSSPSSHPSSPSSPPSPSSAPPSLWSWAQAAVSAVSATSALAAGLPPAAAASSAVSASLALAEPSQPLLSLSFVFPLLTALLPLPASAVSPSPFKSPAFASSSLPRLPSHSHLRYHRCSSQVGYSREQQHHLHEWGPAVTVIVKQRSSSNLFKASRLDATHKLWQYVRKRQAGRGEGGRGVTVGGNGEFVTAAAVTDREREGEEEQERVVVTEVRESAGADVAVRVGDVALTVDAADVAVIHDVLTWVGKAVDKVATSSRVEVSPGVSPGVSICVTLTRGTREEVSKRGESQVQDPVSSPEAPVFFDLQVGLLQAVLLFEPRQAVGAEGVSCRDMSKQQQQQQGTGWSSLRLCFQRITACHVSGLAGNPRARFLMLRHGEGTVWAARNDWWGYGEEQHGRGNKLTNSSFARIRREHEWPVLSTWQDAIGRGSGAPGGNPLERGEAGMCLLLVQWPGQEPSEEAPDQKVQGKARGREREGERGSEGAGGSKRIRGNKGLGESEGRESEGLVYVCVRGLTAEVPGGRWDYLLPLSTLLLPEQRSAAASAAAAAGAAAAGVQQAWPREVRAEAEEQTRANMVRAHADRQIGRPQLLVVADLMDAGLWYEPRGEAWPEPGRETRAVPGQGVSPPPFAACLFGGVTAIRLVADMNPTAPLPSPEPLAAPPAAAPPAAAAPPPHPLTRPPTLTPPLVQAGVHLSGISVSVLPVSRCCLPFNVGAENVARSPPDGAPSRQQHHYGPRPQQHYVARQQQQHCVHRALWLQAYHSSLFAQMDTCHDSMRVLGRLGQQVQLVFPPDAPVVPPGGVTSRVYGGVTVREIGVWDRGLQQRQQGLGQGQNGQGQQQGGRRWARVGGAYGREAADVRSKALRLLLDAVRPNPTVEIDEFRLSVALLPIRLRIDQNHIEFLSRFFSTPISPPPAAATAGAAAADNCASETASAAAAAAAAPAVAADAELLRDALLPFFQVCEIRAFSVLIDYVPRRLDLSALSAGNYAHLLNLISWKGVEIDFTKARVVGVQGWDGLGGALIGQWVEDICRRQLHRVVKAAGPVCPLWALGAASLQLVLLPVQEYRQNKRLMRGVKRGAICFLQSLSHELLGVGVTVAAGTHHLLYAAELALAATAGATTAAATASATNAVAAAVVKGIPAAAMAPVVGAAEALEETLRGMKSSSKHTALQIVTRAPLITLVDPHRSSPPSPPFVTDIPSRRSRFPSSPVPTLTALASPRRPRVPSSGLPPSHSRFPSSSVFPSALPLSPSHHLQPILPPSFHPKGWDRWGGIDGEERMGRNGWGETELSPRHLPPFPPSSSLFPRIPCRASPHPIPSYPVSPALLPPIPFPASPHPLPYFPPSPSLLPLVPFPASPRPLPCFPPSPSLLPSIPFLAFPHPLPCFPSSPPLLSPIPFPASLHPLPCFPPSPSLLPLVPSPAFPHPLPCFPPSPSLLSPIPYPASPHPPPCFPPSPSLLPPIPCPASPHPLPYFPPSPALLPPFPFPASPHPLPCFPPSRPVLPPIPFPASPHPLPCFPPSPSLLPPIPFPVSPNPLPCFPPSPSLLPPHPLPCFPPSPSLLPPIPFPGFPPSPSPLPPIPFPASPPILSLPMYNRKEKGGRTRNRGAAQQTCVQSQ
ncbi:unnamed protein product [Closterium sp. NIES-64]|nr:unnamed protein product [Closterium sp. NIES-64]